MFYLAVALQISTPLRERLSSITSIPVLTGLLNDALVMCHGLGELTKQDVSSELLAGAVKLVLEPLEDQVSCQHLIPCVEGCRLTHAPHSFQDTCIRGLGLGFNTCVRKCRLTHRGDIYGVVCSRDLG